MRIFDIIQHKKEGRELSEEEIRFFIEGYTCGDVPDYQASALCMAICLRGMTEKETAILTDAMTKSGDCVDLSEFGDLSLDKHSTGGVGDKTSLIVAPTVASLGGVVAKMSGRGLGHTGIHTGIPHGNLSRRISRDIKAGWCLRRRSDGQSCTG